MANQMPPPIVPGVAAAGAGAIPPIGVAPIAPMGAAIPSMMAANPAQDKINRELFVGNTPPGTSSTLLITFLTGAMKRTNLCGPTETPIVTCRVNQKFAFIECATMDIANAALNLNGIPFMGSQLKVSRPSKYVGPIVASKTWQELTGTPLPSNVVPMGSPGTTSGVNPEEKLQRELFIGNTTPEMTAQMLTEFLGKAMEQVGLATAPGNPILNCRPSGKFAFIEMRSKEEAANALNLNNIPYLGAQLSVRRPTKYVGPQTPHGNWEDILAKYMSGELTLPSQGGAGAAAAVAAPAPAAVASAVTPTRIVELKNMLTEADVSSDQDYEEIMEDTKEECGSFGALKNVIIPRSGPGLTKIFLEYMTPVDAGKAIGQLAGRTFDGRKVTAVYFNEDKFNSQDYSDDN